MIAFIALCPFLFLIFASVMILRCFYKRCPSNKAIVVYGKLETTEPLKCVHGGGVFVWPLIQGYSELSLDAMNIDVKVPNALAKKNSRVTLTANITFAISTDEKRLHYAAERLLACPPDLITTMANDIAQGQIRLAIAENTSDEIIKNEFVFADKVKERVDEEIGKLGLRVFYINLKDVSVKEAGQ